MRTALEVCELIIQRYLFQEGTDELLYQIQADTSKEVVKSPTLFNGILVSDLDVFYIDRETSVELGFQIRDLLGSVIGEIRTESSPGYQKLTVHDADDLSTFDAGI